MTEHKDFAKILRATNGQQVLVYLDDDTDGDNVCILRSVARFDGYTSSLNIGFDDLSKATLALASADIKMADKVISAITDVVGDSLS